MDVGFRSSGRADDEASGPHDEKRPDDEKLGTDDEKGDPDKKEKASGKESVKAEDVEENAIVCGSESLFSLAFVNLATFE